MCTFLKKCAQIWKMCTFFENVHIFEILQIDGRPASSSDRVTGSSTEVPSASFCFRKWCPRDDTKFPRRFEIRVRKLVCFCKKCAHFFRKCAHLRIKDIRENFLKIPLENFYLLIFYSTRPTGSGAPSPSIIIPYFARFSAPKSASRRKKVIFN